MLSKNKKFVFIRVHSWFPVLGFRSGLTLLEVMIAAGILAIGFIMIAAMFPVALDQARQTNDDILAAQIAQSATTAFKRNGSTWTNELTSSWSEIDDADITDNNRTIQNVKGYEKFEWVAFGKKDGSLVDLIIVVCKKLQDDNDIKIATASGIQRTSPPGTPPDPHTLVLVSDTDGDRLFSRSVLIRDDGTIYRVVISDKNNHKVTLRSPGWSGGSASAWYFYMTPDGSSTVLQKSPVVGVYRTSIMVE